MGRRSSSVSPSSGISLGIKGACLHYCVRLWFKTTALDERLEDHLSFLVLEIRVNLMRWGRRPSRRAGFAPSRERLYVFPLPHRPLITFAFFCRAGFRRNRRTRGPER